MLILLGVWGVWRMLPQTQEEWIQWRLKQVAPCCLAARQYTDLDSLLKALNALKTKYAVLWASNSDQSQRLVEEVEAAILFVQDWRYYLKLDQAGRQAEAAKLLAKVLERKDWFTIMPRSEVLSRYASCRWRNVSIKGRRDLPNAWNTYTQRWVIDPTIPPHSMQELAGIRYVVKTPDAYSNAVEPTTSVFTLHIEDDSLIVRAKLLVLAQKIPAVLNLSKPYQIEPDDEELAPIFNERLMAKAAKRADMVTLWKLSTYWKYINPHISEWDQEQIECLDFCLYGQKKEGEKQFDAAVIYYRSALRRLGSDVVIRFVVSRLNAIKHDYPKEFSVGMDSPCFPRYTDLCDYFANNPPQDRRKNTDSEDFNPYYQVHDLNFRNPWNKY